MRALVTGATGFIGGALARRLRAMHFDVIATGRDEISGRQLTADGIRFVPADIRDTAAMTRLCSGRDRVFHCAALSSTWGRRADFSSINIGGTESIVSACLAARVDRLVHVSSPSVCMDVRHRLDIAETDPLPKKAINAYAWSKREAEVRLLAAAGRGLATVILRPQAVFGPGDRAIFPRILRVAQRGFFPRFGRGESLIDVTCLANAVDALVLAATAPNHCLGQVYHISNGDPWPIDRLLTLLFQELQLNVRRPCVPFVAAYSLAGALEFCHRVTAPRREPALTRYTVCILARSRTLNISRARQDLGFRPSVDVATGIREFATSWLNAHAKN